MPTRPSRPDSDYCGNFRHSSENGATRASPRSSAAGRAADGRTSGPASGSQVKRAAGIDDLRRPPDPATLRDLLRATDGGLDRKSLLERLSDGSLTDAAGRSFEFLESADILDGHGTEWTPSRYGREYLDTHDEGVLYEALTADVASFGTVLEASRSARSPTSR